MTVTTFSLLPSHPTGDTGSAAPPVDADDAAASFACLLGDFIGALQEVGIVLSGADPQTPNQPAGSEDATAHPSDNPKGITAGRTSAAGSPATDSQPVAARLDVQSASSVWPTSVEERTTAPEAKGRTKRNEGVGSSRTSDERKKPPEETLQVPTNPAVVVPQAPQAPLTVIFTPVLRTANDLGVEKGTDLLLECGSTADPVQGACHSAVTGGRVASEAAAFLAVSLRSSLKLRGAVPKPPENPVPSAVPRGTEGASEDSLDVAFAAHLQPKTENVGKPQPLSPAPPAQRDMASTSGVSPQHDLVLEGNSNRQPDSQERERKPASVRPESPPKPLPAASTIVGDEAGPPAPGRPAVAPAHAENTLAISAIPEPQSATATGSKRQTGSRPLSYAIAESPPRPAAAPQSAISIRLGEAGQDRVDVRLQERQGAVQVVVRSSDTDLTASLRSDLNDLVSRLEGRGYQTETWTPTGNLARPTEPSGQESHPDGSQHGRQDGHHGGNQRNQGDSDGGRRDPDDGHPAWLEEFETTVRSKKGVRL